MAEGTTGRSGYSLNRWDGLTKFCDDGRVEISNVLAKNAFRCVALGRSNFLFAGSDSGGERAAAMYCLIGSCKLNSTDPRAYLEFDFTHIADHQANRIDELFRWNVAKHLLPSAPASLCSFLAAARCVCHAVPLLFIEFSRSITRRTQELQRRMALDEWHDRAIEGFIAVASDHVTCTRHCSDFELRHARTQLLDTIRCHDVALRAKHE